MIRTRYFRFSNGYSPSKEEVEADMAMREPLENKAHIENDRDNLIEQNRNLDRMWRDSAKQLVMWRKKYEEIRNGEKCTKCQEAQNQRIASFTYTIAKLRKGKEIMESTIKNLAMKNLYPFQLKWSDRWHK